MNDTITVKTRLKAKKICDVLIRYYGKAVSARKLPPLDELVMTILSQHTNDVNMLRAFESLKERFATWEEVLEAPQEEVALFIKSSGMYNLKAKRIQTALRADGRHAVPLGHRLLRRPPAGETSLPRTGGASR